MSALVVMAALTFSGCGYQVQRRASLPYPEVAVGAIQNLTFEPGLQDRLSRALTEEFLKQGISVRPGSQHVLKAVIKRYELTGLSEKGNVIREYRVFVAADFTLSDEKGKTVLERNVSAPFIVVFTAAEDMGSLVASKELAAEKAIRDLAVEIAGALIYR